MPIRLTTYLILALTALLSGCSTTSHQPEPDSGPVQPIDEYQQQKQKLIDGDPSVDFTKFRWAFRESSGYTSWDTTEHEANIAMLNAIDDGNYEFCLRLANAILEQNYTSLSGHLGMYRCNDVLDNQDTASYHLSVISGIVESIEASGDGQSAETAFVTTTPNEMRNYLLLKGLTSFRQELADATGKYIERVYLIDVKTGDLATLYFDNSASLIPNIKPSFPTFN